MAKSMDEIPSYGKTIKWSDFVTVWEWDKNGQFQLARFFGDVWVDAVHSIMTKNGNQYPEFCHGWDVDACEFYPDAKERCPACALDIKASYRYFINAIDLEVEENRPQKPKADWSPVRLVSMPVTLFNKLKDLKIVNKAQSITDRDHGAIVQIKYIKDTDPSNMYHASMDTKDVAITEEQKQYIVVQKYPDGSQKTVKGVNGYPARFEYIRCVNSRDNMIKSLRTHGYYGKNGANDGASHSFSQPSLEEATRADAESAVETMDLSNVFANPVVPATEVPASTTKGPCIECPTAFGKFSNTIECYTNCEVAAECKAATNANVKSKSNQSEMIEATLPSIGDDDDMV